MMKKTAVLFVAVLVAAANSAWAHEGRDSEHGAGGKGITVQGELVDLSCYMAHEGKGPKHAPCAKMCVQGGAPLGLLAKDGAVYLLLDDHSSARAGKPYAEAKKLVAETVTLSGDLHQRGGMKTIVVEKVDKE